MAEAAVLSEEWTLARNYLIDLLDSQPKKEVCLLMARIEDSENGDIQKSNSWNLRSKNGKDNNIWVCSYSKESQTEWGSVSMAGHFNSLEWKQPHMLNQFIISEKTNIYEN